MQVVFCARYCGQNLAISRWGWSMQFDVAFDALDEVEKSQGDELLKELERVGVHAEITKLEKSSGFIVTGSVVALIAVATASVAALAVVAAFIQRVFRRGVLIDLRASPPKIQKTTE